MSIKTVEKVNDDFLDDFFGDSTTSVLTEEEIKKQESADKNIKTFSTAEEELELDFLNEPFPKGEVKKEKEVLTPDKKAEADTDADADKDKDKDNNIIDYITKDYPDEVDTFSVINELIESGELLGFEDQKIESTEDLRQLLLANIENARSQPVEEFKNEFFESLPEEIKIIHEYAKKGASSEDIRSLFKSFSKMEETYKIDSSTPDGQKKIIRDYLLQADFGTNEEISQEIEDWEDLDKLEEKALKFKPKLEKIEEKNVADKLKEQQERDKRQREFQQTFIENIKSATNRSTLVNLKLAKSERVSLENDLLQNNYVSSLSGRPLNALGKALEDISFVTPNPEFLAEITYFATKPEEFIKNLTEQIKQKEIGNTIKKLKTRTVTNSAPESAQPTKNKYRGINDMN